jgi:choline-sulfatase
MPRQRPRLRLALLLVGIALLSFATVLAIRSLPLRQARSIEARRAPPLQPVELEPLREALAAQPELPLDLEHTDVLVMMVCTFRRDRLQPYGQSRPTTPFLQELAERGVLFEHAIVQSPWTRPSTGSLLTGLYSEVLQLDDPAESKFQNRALAEGFVTLAERFRALGYRTIGASGNPNISSTYGFHQGFDAYHEPDSLWRDAGGPPPSGAEINAQLLAELDATPADRRVYLQGFYVDTHAPRSPSTMAVRTVRGGEGSTRRVLSYDASLLHLDSHLAQLFLEVKRRRPNLVVVVVGDHGEGLRHPSHHGQGHGNHLYTTTVDVPLLWHHPALPQPGRRIGGLAMGVDLPPTLLDLLGGPAPEGLDGASQAAALRGLQDRAVHDVAFTQTYFRRSDKTAVIADGFHLIRDRNAGGTSTLYALDEPLQQTDLGGERPEVLQQLAAKLSSWEERVAAQAAGHGPTEGTPSEGMLEQLRTLGYIE